MCIILLLEPFAPVYAVFMDHHQTENGGEVPETVLEQTSGISFAPRPPHPPRSAKQDRTGDQTGHGECPSRQTEEGEQNGAGGDEDNGMPQGNKCVFSWG